MQRHLRQTDEIDTDPVVYQPLRRHAKHIFVDDETTCSRGDDEKGEARSNEVSIDIMFVIRI